MVVTKHGLSVGIERINDNFWLSLKGVGKLTHEDYEIITPMIDSALLGVKKPNIKVFMDATEMEGWELRAAWDDFKLGVKYGSDFDKVAIAGNKSFLDIGAKLAEWFISGDIKYFDDVDSALSWLQEDKPDY